MPDVLLLHTNRARQSGGLRTWLAHYGRRIALEYFRRRNPLKALPFLFRAPPQVASGVLAQEAERAWHDWNPLVWRLIKMRRFMTVPEVTESPVRRPSGYDPSFLRRLMHGLSRWLPHRLGPLD